jgi:flagellar protein FliT
MNQPALVERVFQMTQEIGHAAALADWPEAARLTEERSPLLMSIVREQDAASLDLIRKIQEMDAAIVSNAATTRDELQTEYRAAINRVNAASQYNRVARM